MKRLIALLAAPALAFAALPAMAQDADEDIEEVEGSEDMGDLGLFGAMLGLFNTEPLTAEEEARLPLASDVVAKVMPEGSYARMMQQTMGGILDPLMSLMPDTLPPEAIALTLGMDESALDGLSEEELDEIAAALDPAYAERAKAASGFMMTAMGEAMAAVEPGMREGLSRAYAKRFSTAELEDIAAFFATPTGARYATESMLVFTDPEVMSSSMQAFPAVLGSLGDIETGMEAALAEIPPERTFADLTAKERKRLGELLDISMTELEQGMAAGVELKAAREAEDSWESDEWDSEEWESDEWDDGELEDTGDEEDYGVIEVPID